MEKRVIFDLDGTLLNCDYSKEDDFFRNYLSESDANKFIPIKYELLLEYEDKFPRYDITMLSSFLSNRSGISIDEELIKKWIKIGSTFDDEYVEDIINTLKYLKDNNYKLSVLTNWFDEVQINRLKKMKLLDYFDIVSGGCEYIKPNINSYLSACGSTHLENCTMIGDNYSKDVLGARSVGLNAIHYSPKGDSKDKCMIKRMNEVKEILK